MKELYNGNKHSPYYYTYGFSWRAYASYIAGILINIVCFAGSVRSVSGQSGVPKGAQYIYNVNYFAGIIVSSLCYYILCFAFPVQQTSCVWNEAPREDESMDRESDDPENNYYVARGYVESDCNKSMVETSKRAW